MNPFRCCWESRVRMTISTDAGNQTRSTTADDGITGCNATSTYAGTISGSAGGQTGDAGGVYCLACLISLISLQCDKGRAN